MTYAPVKPEDAVFVLADLQSGIVERAAMVEPAFLRCAVATLAKLAKLFDISVVVTTAPVQGAPEL